MLNKMDRITALMSSVKWERVNINLTEAQKGKSENYVTHQGILTIGPASIRVYQLNDGSRILDKDDADRFFNTDLSTTTEPTMFYTKDR